MRPRHAETMLIQINAWSGFLSTAVIYSDGNPINTIACFSHEIGVKDLLQKGKNDFTGHLLDVLRRLHCM